MRFWLPLLLTSSMLAGLALASAERALRLDHGWEVSWGSDDSNLNSGTWRSVDLPCVSTFDVNDWKIMARVPLPPFYGKDASLFIKQLDQPFTVDLDGVEIYRFGNLASQRREFLGLPWHIIPLPDGFQGKYLNFTLRKSADPKTGLCDEVLIGSRADHITQMIVNNFDVIVLTTVSVVTAMINLIVALSMRSSKPYTAFAFFALTTGTWVFSNSSNQIKLLLIDNPVMWSWFDLTSLYLIPAFLLLFVYQVFGNYQAKILLGLSLLHFAYTVGATTLSASGVIDPKAALFPFNCIVPISILVLSVYTVILMTKKQADAGLIGAALLLMLGFAVHDLMVGLQLLPWTRHTLQFGLTSMLVPFSIIVVRRVHQLLDTQKEAEFNAFKERQRSEIMQNLAHDIKNPLAVFELISGSKTWEDFLSWKPEMARSISRVHAIIADFKKDADAITLKISPFTLDLVGIASDANKTLGSKRVTITADSGNDGASVQLDRIAIERAIINLLTNAVEAGASSVVVSSRITNHDLLIAVIDNWPGVPAQILNRLFQRGQSFGKQGGQGIGLYNVQSIAAGHGGNVNYRRNGEHSIFEIYLPGSVMELESAAHAGLSPQTPLEPISQQNVVMVAIMDQERRQAILHHLANYPVKIHINETGSGLASIVLTDDHNIVERYLAARVPIMMDNGKDDPEKIARQLVRRLKAISEHRN